MPLCFGTETHEGTRSQNQTHHVQDRRNTRRLAFFGPRCVVRHSEAAAAVLDRPVNSRIPGLEQAALPLHTLFAPFGRHDRTPVGWGRRLVLGDPGAGLPAELVDCDHGIRR